MLRTISLAVAGLLLAGCESTGIQGTTAYRDDNVHGDANYVQGVSGDRDFHGRVAGAREYGNTPLDESSRTTVVTRSDEDAQAASARRDAVTVEGRPGDRAAVAAAVAASDALRYPRDLKATNDLTATAVIDPTYGSIKIANASDRDLRNVTVWVDGKYSAQVGQVPARGTVTISRSDLVNREGSGTIDLKDASRIQLQTRDNLYNVQGPVFDRR